MKQTKETRYAYNYAIIDRETKMCIEVRSTTGNSDDSSNEELLYVRIPSMNYDYMMKYYDETTGRWFYDSQMQNEWFPPVE